MDYVESQRARFLAVLQAAHDHGIGSQDFEAMDNQANGAKSAAGGEQKTPVPVMEHTGDNYYVDPEGVQALLKKLDYETRAHSGLHAVLADAHFHGIRPHLEDDSPTVRFDLRTGKRVPLLKKGNADKPAGVPNPHTEILNGASEMIGQPNTTSMGGQMHVFGVSSLPRLMKF